MVVDDPRPEARQEESLVVSVVQVSDVVVDDPRPEARPEESLVVSV